MAPSRDDLGPLTELPGIGPRRAELFARLGVECVRDLLMLVPRRLQSWGGRIPIANARERVGELVVVQGRVRGTRMVRLGGRRNLVRVSIEDGTEAIDLLFFNQPWIRERMTTGREFEVAGQVVKTPSPALSAPRVGSEDRPIPPEGSLEPEYPKTDGLGETLLTGSIRAALEGYSSELEDVVPAAWLEELGVPRLADAVRAVHAPESMEAFVAGRRRLALEAWLALEARLAARRVERRGGSARPVDVGESAQREVAAMFPFELTGGQRQVLGELVRDLGKTLPMRRLLQGDVGCGKTAVALFAAICVARAGGQVCVLAPTELLAEQHLAGARPLLEGAGLTCELITGSLRARVRKQRSARVAAGEVDVVFGTHALMSEGLEFARLDLAVIDEQQRFGVSQRAKLQAKGVDVHLLLMTATPIPRTLALALYGDLDVSVLREAPGGRGELETRWIRDRGERHTLRRLLGERLERGEQAFWVCPRIGGEGKQDTTAGGPSAEKRYRQLCSTELNTWGVVLVHGGLPAEERAERLDRFRRGEVRLCVATTVIEVGVDVPQATVLVVEGADRFGLAQLHQLRGRVGRGAGDSLCVLLGKPTAASRLELLEQTRDGFRLAEEDLRQRGMGDLAGSRQSGANAEGLAALASEPETVQRLRELCAEDPSPLAHYAGAVEPVAP